MMQAMTTTKIGPAGEEYRATLPRALAREIDIYDRDQQHVHFAVRCDGRALALAMRIGPSVDPNEMNTLGALVHSSGQVQFKLPVWLVDAWGLDGYELEWPNADATDVELVGRVVDWEPQIPVDLFRATDGVSHRSAVTIAGQEQQSVETSIPTALADAIGLTDAEARARITFDCVDGRKVLVVSRNEVERSELRNSLAVHLAGAQQSQARISAGRVAQELDIYDRLQPGESVPLRWYQQDDEHLIAFAVEEGSADA